MGRWTSILPTKMPYPLSHAGVPYANISDTRASNHDTTDINPSSGIAAQQHRRKWDALIGRGGGLRYRRWEIDISDINNGVRYPEEGIFYGTISGTVHHPTRRWSKIRARYWKVGLGEMPCVGARYYRPKGNTRNIGMEGVRNQGVIPRYVGGGISISAYMDRSGGASRATAAYVVKRVWHGHVSDLTENTQRCSIGAVYGIAASLRLVVNASKITQAMLL